MKLILTIAFIAINSMTLLAQNDHIEQSTPFENILNAMKSDSISLFIKSFSNRIIDGEYDKNIWASRLNEGKEKFAERFGAFELNDFSYAYEKEKSKLIIFFKGEEQFRIRVIQEDDVWKLDEK